MSIIPLIAFLQDEDRTLRSTAIKALGKIKDPRSVEPLIAILQSSDTKVRVDVIKALSAIKDPRSVEPLTAVLQDTDKGVRVEAARALGEIGDPRAVEPLIAALRDENKYVREDAIKALGKIKDPRSVEPLIAVLQDGDEYVRLSAVRALGEIRDLRSVEPLIAVLQDENRSVRRDAIAALGKIGDPRSVEPLIAALQDAKEDVRLAAIGALGRIKDPCAVGLLIAALQDANNNVQWIAAQALGWMDDPHSVELLLAILQNGDKGKRRAIFDALGFIGDPRAVDPLIAALQDTDKGIRLSAAEALGRIKDSRAVDPLITAFQDREKEVRERVIQALGRIGDPQAAEYLIAALRDTDISSLVQWAASSALGRMKDPHTVALLITALQDADKGVREGAVRALGEIKDPDAVEPLIAVLQDTDKGVRVEAARALGEIGDPRAVEPLIAMQRDADRGIRRAAVEALTRIGDPRTVELLREIDPLELLEIRKGTVQYKIDPEAWRTYRPPSFSSPTDQDRLQFSAFYPKVANAGEWHTLFVYAHITSALKAIRRDADKFRDALGLIHGEVNAQTKEPMLKGTQITIVPSCQKVTFNPDRFSFRWLEDWQQIKFRFLPEEELAGSASNGEISVYVGSLIVATLKIAFLFETKELISGVKDDVAQATSYVYQRIFASYSHDDSSVVLACRNVSKILGNEYLIDIDKLRTGQYWNPAILKMIDDADIFQLFWSERAAQSQYVTQEWQHALQCQKGEGFIRPVYWEKPLVPPPQELSHMHFAYFELPKLETSGEKREGALGNVRIEVGKDAGRVYEVRKESFSIGRIRERDICLEDMAVSPLHATIIYLGNNNYALRDEGSANGTKVNGQSVNKYQSYPLQEGDKIQLGHQVLVFFKS